ncbi:hypothetical protein B0T24DRAFT_221606 [Lasiosphaeria ovina]|uniref:Uncharacterized protein n=1 Tax=Lasiosphaeria ovina TaxID=92902 RepID=A0AAE0NA82_9PEZI|nr:hypothetical protein B0T24DRAFT_221606 [Lasiosphaeria ovina]
MSTKISECERLVDRIDDEFIDPTKAQVESTKPGKIMESTALGVALWAHHTGGSGPILVDMRMPGLKRELKKLAGFGLGAHTTTYQGVTYKFVKTKNSSSTDSNLSSL